MSNLLVADYFKPQKIAQDYAKNRFLTYHPSLLLGFFTIAILLTMVSLQPVLAGTNFVLGWIMSLVFVGWKPMLKRLPLYLGIIGLVALANSWFTSIGMTTLFTIGNHNFTLESFVFGLTTGAILVGMLIWFRLATFFLSNNVILGTINRFAPNLALMISMILKLVPAFVKRAQLVELSKLALNPKKIFDSKIKQALTITSALVAWSMEESFDTAASMQARGYGATKRTSFRSTGLKDKDLYLSIWLIFSGSISIILSYLALQQFQFYPLLPRIKIWWGYLPYILFLSTPLLISLWGWLKWQISK